MRSWVRRGIVVCSVAVVALFGGLFVYNTATMGSWTAEELGDGWHWCASRYFTESMVDSDGNPHVVYTSSEGIVHARDTGEGWQTTVVPVFNSVEATVTCCALMDDRDCIHVFISYTASADDVADSHELVHLTDAGGSWSVSNITGLSGIDYYYTLACAEGPQDELHLISVGATRSTAPGDLVQDLKLIHWQFDGTEWNVTPVLSLPGDWDGAYFTDVEVDESGDLHAVGLTWGTYTLGGLMYASSDGDQWSMELLPWTPDGLPARLALHGAAPYIGMSVDGRVLIVTEQGDSWTEFAGLQTGNEWGSPLDIDFAPDGTLHVLYGAFGDVPNLEAWHATVKDGVTTTERVHDSLYWKSFPSISVDDGGDVHMAFSAYHTATYATDGIDSLLVRAAGDAVQGTALIAGVCLAVVVVSAVTALGIIWLRRGHLQRCNEGD
ncbi:MAG: hypothetical protein MUO94_05285 [Thermoplasmata archaeon]|nr:hypothetical protein [Thermoplasmata archaeon]